MCDRFLNCSHQYRLAGTRDIAVGEAGEDAGAGSDAAGNAAARRAAKIARFRLELDVRARLEKLNAQVGLLVQGTNTHSERVQKVVLERLIGPEQFGSKSVFCRQFAGRQMLGTFTTISVAKYLARCLALGPG